MAREFANTAGSPNIDYVTYSAVPPVAGLGTCSIVMRMAGDSDTPSFGTAIAATSASFLNDVGIQRNSSANSIRGMFRNAGASSHFIMSFGFDGVIQSVIFTFDGSATPKGIGYLNGVDQSVTNVAVTNTVIGSGQNAMLVGGVPSYRWNGRIAEAAIYNRVITPAEALIHAAGYSTNHFPRGRIFCTPLIREVHDIVGGLTGTITGTTVSDHPRIYA